MRAFSKISADWWDYTTLDREILDAAARITIDNLKSFERPGFHGRCTAGYARCAALEP